MLGDHLVEIQMPSKKKRTRPRPFALRRPPAILLPGAVSLLVTSILALSSEAFTPSGVRRWEKTRSSLTVKRKDQDDNLNKFNPEDVGDDDQNSFDKAEEDLILKELSPFIGASDWLEEDDTPDRFFDEELQLELADIELPKIEGRQVFYGDDDEVEEYAYTNEDDDDAEEEEYDEIIFEDDEDDIYDGDNVIVLKRWKRGLSHDYLRHTLQLPDSCMWRITKYAPSALGMKATTIQAKVEVLKEALNLSGSDIQILLEKQPSLLNLSAEGNLKPTLVYLAQNLDLQSTRPTDQDILRELVLECPSILTISMENLQSKFQFFQKNAGFSVSQMRKLVQKEPKLLTTSVKTLHQRWQFLHRELQFPRDKLRELILKDNSRVFMKNLDADLRPKIIFFFIMTLQMTKEEVLKLLLKYPPIMDISLENRLRPILQYLVQLEFSNYEVSRMILKSPRFVTSSLLTIKHVIGYLRFELGLQASDVRRILYQTPQVCSHASD